MEILKITVKDIVVRSTLKSLLAAQCRLADEGSGADLVRVSKYLMRLSKKYGDVIAEVVQEGGQKSWQEKH